MAIYVGVNGAVKKVSSIYVGVNGSPKEASTICCGASGTAKTVFKAVAPPGQTVFTSSGTFTVPKGIKQIKVFAVGGGGGCGSSWVYSDNGVDHGGNGGGGGYTKTSIINVNPGDSISVSIGTGGVAKGFSQHDTTGSNTIVQSIVANGGHGGGKFIFDSPYINSIGGSGGGKGGSGYSSTVNLMYGGNGGSDGSNGYLSKSGSASTELAGTNWGGRYLGQGSTTRAFGESTGTIYAGGGGGGTDFTGIGGRGGSGGGGNGGYGKGKIAPTSGGYATGGGAGGDYCDYTLSGGYRIYDDGNSRYFLSTPGGSGIAIIRWGY